MGGEIIVQQTVSGIKGGMNDTVKVTMSNLQLRKKAGGPRVGITSHNSYFKLKASKLQARSAMASFSIRSILGQETEKRSAGPTPFSIASILGLESSSELW